LLAEDVTCIAAGALVASGRIGFLEAALACFIGITIGDLGLYVAGRLIGRRILELPLIKSRISPVQLERASAWLAQRGAVVVFASRFTPGMRLPVYLAAGTLRTSAVRFTLYFTIASAVWTPILVGASAWLGRENARLLALAAAAFLVSSYLFTWERRRRLLGLWRSIVRWEFWPVWAAYLPVLPWILILAVRHRSLTLFTVSNPGILAGGFAGESKSEILTALEPSGAVAPFTIVRAGEPSPAPQQWPVVLKPDVGERGDGVVIAHDEAAWSRYLKSAPGDTIVQTYVPGLEFGILYCRHPDERQGRILSITEKRFPAVTGDGRRTLKELILADDRAVCLASVYLTRNPDRTPSAGERVVLVNIGSHCKGAMFMDARRVCTPELTARIDEISKVHPEFYLGRYDVRTPSLQHLQNGQFTVIELNGVTGEPAHTYDPSVSLLDAYRAMFLHWRLAFQIGARNRERGYSPIGFAALWRIVRERGGSPSVTRGVRTRGGRFQEEASPAGGGTGR